MTVNTFHSGFACIIGAPNVGKSTLLNTIVGEKVAITTHKPQTTRTRITGIKNLTKGQIIFIDTPGIHQAQSRLNKRMVETALAAINDADCCVYVLGAVKNLTADDDIILRNLENITTPVVLVINKIDLINKEQLLPMIDRLQHVYPFDDIVPLSALKNVNVDDLVDTLVTKLPLGPPLFPDDIFTESSERFLAAEMIREKIILLTHQEIPYATAVTIDSFHEDPDRTLLSIHATINVEKKAQKGIVIGKGGAMLKKIGTQSRRDMETFFKTKIFLKLFVRHTDKWSEKTTWLEEFGYTDK